MERPAPMGRPSGSASLPGDGPKDTRQTKSDQLPDRQGAREISVAEISTDTSPQMRAAGTDPSTVQEYADAMVAGAIFPAVIVYHDGTAYYVADGFHRVDAALQAGRETILVEVREGSRRDAILAAAGANATHGLRRTNADKRRAVETLLRDPDWTSWSDREVGKACAVDHKTVARVRRELTGEIPADRKVTYTDRHGNRSEMRVRGGGSGAGSILDKVLSRVSDDALIAECGRRGIEVMFDYDALKALAQATGCRVTDLLVLAQQNDPFYAGQPGRRERAEWFAEIWEKFGFRHGAHLRRIHYQLISQSEPVRWPDGTPYENTLNNWSYLISASLGARYLGLVPDAVLIDRRNPDPIIKAAFRGEPDPEVARIAADFSLDIPSEFPVPELYLSGFRRDQDHLVELWAEKSTMNDILVPLANRLGFNLVTGLGEMSETATRLAVERAIDADKPMRILYVSDFDPAGRSMPVAVARKIEYRLHDAGIDGADVQLHPIVLTPEQCIAHRLPRTPIKETERRARRFEERFGAGATELDALEALHPGILEEIVTTEVGRYLDATLEQRVGAAASQISRRIAEVEREVRTRHADEIGLLSEEYDALLAHAAELETAAAGLWERIEEELVGNAPFVQSADIPVPRDSEPIETPLYDSTRDYLDQLDNYKFWQHGTGGRWDG